MHFPRTIPWGLTLFQMIICKRTNNIASQFPMTYLMGTQYMKKNCSDWVRIIHLHWLISRYLCFRRSSQYHRSKRELPSFDSGRWSRGRWKRVLSLRSGSKLKKRKVYSWKSTTKREKVQLKSTTKKKVAHVICTLGKVMKPLHSLQYFFLSTFRFL